MDDLLQQTQNEAVDLVGAWQKGNVNQRQELATAFFPEGLVFSHERGFFEPANVVIHQMVWRFVTNEIDFGVPGRRCLNSAIHLRAFLLRWADCHSCDGTEVEPVDSAFCD